MKKIKILEFCNQWGIGGTEKTAYTFCKHLDKDIFEVYAAGYQGGEQIPELKQVVKDHIITENEEELIEWITHKKIQIAHFHRFGTAEPKLINILKKSNIPCLIEHNIFGQFDESEDREKINKHILLSLTQKKQYKEKAGINYNEKKIEIIYNPVDEEYLKETQEPNYQQPIFGRHSRKDPLNWDIISILSLPKIKKEIPNAKFHIVGLIDEYREEIKKINCEDMILEFRQTPNKKEIKNFLKSISVYAHSSAIGETFGIKIAEAMSLGLPIITHRGGGNTQTEIVQHNHTGYIVNENDVEDYANKIIYLLKNPNKKKELGQNAKIIAKERFNPQKITKQLENVFLKEYYLTEQKKN